MQAVATKDGGNGWIYPDSGCPGVMADGFRVEQIGCPGIALTRPVGSWRVSHYLIPDRVWQT